MRVLLLSTSLAFLFSWGSRVLVEQRGGVVVYNSGIAFGIDLPLLHLFIPLALVLVIWCAWQGRRSGKQSIAYGLILGGAVANIVDRLSDGLVTDFIAVPFWPTFNTADSCITIGVLLLLAHEVRLRYHSQS